MIKGDLTIVDRHPRNFAPARPPASARRASLKSDVTGSWHPSFSVLPHGIGLGPGVGVALQMAPAQGGRGVGAGTWKSLPWVEANPPDMQEPVKVLMSG